MQVLTGQLGGELKIGIRGRGRRDGDRKFQIGRARGRGLADGEGDFGGDDPGRVAVDLGLKRDLRQVGGGSGPGGDGGAEAGEAEVGGDFLRVAGGGVEHEERLAGAEAGEPLERGLLDQGAEQGAQFDPRGQGRAGFLRGGEAKVHHVLFPDDETQAGQVGVETGGAAGGAQPLDADGVEGHQRRGGRAVAHAGQNQGRGGFERHAVADGPQAPGAGDRATEGKLGREEREPRGGQAVQADLDQFVGGAHGGELAGGGGEGESLARGDGQNGIGARGHVELEGAHPGLGRVGVEVEAGVQPHRAERGQAEGVEGVDHELERAGEADALRVADGEVAFAGETHDGEHRQGRERGEVGVADGDFPPAGQIGRAGSPAGVELEEIFVGRDQTQGPRLAGTVAGDAEVGAEAGGATKRTAGDLGVDADGEGGELAGVVKGGQQLEGGGEVGGGVGFDVEFQIEGALSAGGDFATRQGKIDRQRRGSGDAEDSGEVDAVDREFTRQGEGGEEAGEGLGGVGGLGRGGGVFAGVGGGGDGIVFDHEVAGDEAADVDAAAGEVEQRDIGVEGGGVDLEPGLLEAEAAQGGAAEADGHLLHLALAGEGAAGGGGLDDGGQQRAHEQAEEQEGDDDQGEDEFATAGHGHGEREWMVEMATEMRGRGKRKDPGGGRGVREKPSRRDRRITAWRRRRRGRIRRPPCARWRGRWCGGSWPRGGSGWPR